MRRRSSERLGSPVSGSWLARRASSRSSALRSDRLRVLSTIPPTSGRCSRLVATVSASSQLPSWWWTRHSIEAVRRGADLAKEAGEQLAVVRVHQACQRQAEQLAVAVAEHPLDRPRGVAHHAVGACHHDHVEGALYQRTEARLAGA